MIDNIRKNPNCDGWARLIELLDEARKDKRINSSAGASEFIELMRELACDSLTASTADQAIQPLTDITNAEQKKRLNSDRAINAINARHDKQGGSRAKAQTIKDI